MRSFCDRWLSDLMKRLSAPPQWQMTTFRCRVALEDVAVGEQLLGKELLHHEAELVVLRDEVVPGVLVFVPCTMMLTPSSIAFSHSGNQYGSFRPGVVREALRVRRDVGGDEAVVLHCALQAWRACAVASGASLSWGS